MSTRDRYVAGILAVAAAMAAVWFLVVAPKRQEATGLGAQVVQAQARRDAAIARATTVEQARAAYRKDYATIARLGKAVPPRGDVASLVFQLESAARAAKVDFRSVSVESLPTTAPTAAATPGDAAAKATADASPATTADVAPQPFTFSFEGSFRGLRRLLGAIDHFSRVDGDTLAVSGRLLTVDSVVMTAGRGGLPNVKADIVAKAYVADLPALLPGTKTTPAAAAVTAP
jgi:hypothetical protein